MNFQDAAPSKLLPLRVKGKSLVAGEDDLVLESLSSSAEVVLADGGVVVALTSDQGATSQYDVALAQVPPAAARSRFGTKVALVQCADQRADVRPPLCGKVLATDILVAKPLPVVLNWRPRPLWF